MISFGKRLIAPVLVAACAVSALGQTERSVSDFGPTLERLEIVEVVLARNPGVAAARSAIRVMEARLVVAGSLEDPEVATSIAPLTLDDSSIGARISVSQQIPWPGRLEAREDVVRANLAMREAELRNVRIELALAASDLYDRWYLLHRALELNEHHHMLAEQMKSSAEAHYVVGNASQQDPLQAEVRLTRLLRERIEIEAELRSVAAALNALLHENPQNPLPAPVESLSVPAMPVDPATVTTGRIEDRPEVESAEASLREGEAELRLARLERRPDLMAMGEWSSMWMNEDHRLMAGIGFRLPVRRTRIDAGIRAAEASVDERRAGLDAVKDRAMVDLQQALFELDSARETLTLYEDLLIPASQDQVEAAQVGFSTGRNSFLAVLDAEKNLQEVLLGYHVILTRAWSAHARAKAALGTVPFTPEVPSHE